MSYLFGDDLLAARRLRILAGVFRPASEDFLEAWTDRSKLAVDRTPTVVDLGCGPGFTTRLLARRLDCPVIGLDSSDAFLYEARRLRPTRVSYRKHDVTATPFPLPPADLLYARLLLTHLADVPNRVRQWSSQLADGGWLLVEEVDSIDTRLEPFRQYLDLVAESLRRGGTELYIGRHLSEWAAAAGLAVSIDRLHRLPVRNADAAAMFRLNLPTLRRSADLGASALGEKELDRLQDRLDDIAYGDREPIGIEWTLRQVAARLEKRPTES